MKQTLLLFILITKCSFVLPMAPDPVAHIRRQIAGLKAEGLTADEIAQVATNTLQSLLDYPLLRFPLGNYISQYKALIGAGADKNVRHPKNGKTALMFAAIDGRPDIVKALLALGVDPTIADSNGCTVSQQYPVINEFCMPEIHCLSEEAEIASSIQKLKISE